VNTGRRRYLDISNINIKLYLVIVIIEIRFYLATSNTKDK